MNVLHSTRSGLSSWHQSLPTVCGAPCYTSFGKVSPGILGVVLLVQRRIRSAATTAGFGVVFVALCVLRSGTSPIKSFLTYALPRLSSGRAFPFMATEVGILTNMSPFGFPFKLHFRGLDVGDPWHLARRSRPRVPLAAHSVRAPGFPARDPGCPEHAANGRDHWRLRVADCSSTAQPRAMQPRAHSVNRRETPLLVCALSRQPGSRVARHP